MRASRTGPVGRFLPRLKTSADLVCRRGFSGMGCESIHVLHHHRNSHCRNG